MAGFQQAANAIVGAPGQIMRATGIYNELVGKNEELIKELGSKNEELGKKNEELTKKKKELTKKNEELGKKNEELDLMNSNLISSLKLNLKQNELTQNIAKRLYANKKARASRDRMLEVLYGKKTETTAVPNVKSKEGGK